MNALQTEFHRIGPDEPPYLIAEIGLNHNGEKQLAFDSIDAAARSGAAAVKFQLYDSDYFIAADASLGDQGPGSLREFFRGFELPAEVWPELARYARAAGVDFFCSVFDQPSLALYATLDCRLIKIASCDITNRPLIEAARQAGLPLILSTGTASEEEVRRALEWWRPGPPPVLLQCVSSYPARPEDYNLNVLPRWRSEFDLPVGISDHCEGNAISLAAVALGACVVERHFTMDRNLPGPDHALSLEPADLESLAAGMRSVYVARGDGHKRPVAAEDPPRKFGRRSLYSASALRAGATVRATDLIPLRPGGGTGAEHFDEYVGKIWRRDLEAGTLITSEMVSADGAVEK